MIELFRHNQNAYEAVKAQLRESGKAAVIHPTGTGKSFIALKLVEENPQARFVWLSPSEYIFQTQMENVKKIAGFEPKNVAFLTYTKLMMTEESELRKLCPDYIILDEFHRCGAPEWSKGVERLLGMYPGAKLLGLTATNIRYLDNQRDMADELFDGCVASHMSLSEAVVQGILPAPKYVVTMYSCQEELDRYARRVKKAGGAARQAAEEYLQQLRRKLEQSEGLDEIFARHMQEKAGKYLCFCASREHMKQMRAKVGEWFAKVDAQPHVYEVYAESPEAREKYEQFRKDDSDRLKLLFCIDMLNEGIHVDDVAGVILFRPTVSPIIYKQQIGRALSAAKKNAPVILDVVNNYNNLYSIAGLRKEMEEVVSLYRSEHRDELIVQKEFEVIDELRECRELFDKIENSLEASWDLMYYEAKRYYEAHGDLNMATKYRTETGLPLGKWLLIQREVRQGLRAGRLDPEQIEKLDRIGMQWNRVEERNWELGCEQARRYREARGDLNVPVEYVTEDGYPLGKWIVNMRIRYKGRGRNAPLSGEQIARLDALGMIWDSFEDSWERGFAEAQYYARTHGDLNPPLSYVRNGIYLRRWLSTQRQRMKQGKLATKRKERLDALGMIWNRPDSWDENYREAQTYFAEHGTLEISPDYVASNGAWLGKWITLQRKARQRGELSQEKIQRLDELGMRWGAKKVRFNEGLEEAKYYLNLHGDLNPPSSYERNGVRLRTWLNRQRRNSRQGKLSRTHEEEMKALGAGWK